MESSDNQITSCDDCMVCLCQMNVPTDTITTNCGHIFHTECISIWHDKQTNVFNCPACRESLKSTPKIIYDIPDSNNTLYTFFSGDTLEGVRKNGEFTGQCKYTYLTENYDPLIQVGDTLEGTYENGEFTGQCKYTYLTENNDPYIRVGDTLEGTYENGEFTGYCERARSRVGYKQEGIYKNGEFEGGGTKITYSNGRIYVYENGRDCIGHCKITFPDGHVVEYEQNFDITGNPVFQYDKKSRLIKRFDSIRSCAKSLKCSRYQITNRLKGIKYQGIYWRHPSYLDRYLDQYIFSGMKL